MRAPSGGIASPAPEIATGTIGTPASIASLKGPARKGRSVPSRLRVPSAKRPTAMPASR